MLIRSTAHEYQQALPLAENTLVCSRCGYRTQIGAEAERRCTPHYESATSGYRQEGD